MENIVTVSTNPAYQFDKTTQYYTFGAGYRYKSLYLDMAYVHKSRKSEYRAIPPIVGTDAAPAIGSSVSDENDRVSLTIGFRF